MIRGNVSVSENGSVTIGDWINLLDDSAKGPAFRVIRRFEQIYAKMFAQTQLQTHVLTGSLKASGRTSTEFDGDEWYGEITYGGPAYRPPMGPGPLHDPVDYAIYEMARGGQHDFFRGLEPLLDEFEDAVNEAFPG